MTLEYDGMDYFGWQLQPELPTVQGTVEKALSCFLRDGFRLIGASRTDAGVHAAGQVASLHLDGEDKPERVRGAVNGNLPRDIYVKDVVVASDSFNARRDARAKRYVYSMKLGFSPLSRRYAWEYAGHEPEMPILERLASALPGRRDMRALSPGHEEENTMVEIFSARWEREGDNLAFAIEGDRFLYRLVRNLVGIMVREASGRAEPGTLERGLSGEAVQIHTAPAHGLCLQEVFYEKGT